MIVKKFYQKNQKKPGGDPGFSKVEFRLNKGNLGYKVFVQFYDKLHPYDESDSQKVALSSKFLITFLFLEPY